MKVYCTQVYIKKFKLTIAVVKTTWDRVPGTVRRNSVHPQSHSAISIFWLDRNFQLKEKLNGVGPPLITDPPPNSPSTFTEKKREKKCNVWHMTCDTWHATCDMPHMTCDTWHATRGGEVNIFQKIQLPSSYGLGGKVIRRFGGKGWLN